MANGDALPFGVHDLDPNIIQTKDEERSVLCFVNGCTQELKVPTRKYRGDVCSKHGIRCHYSSKRPTYSYIETGRNIIASAELFTNSIVGHPFKFESHRLGAERSEDALSWNVFRSLQEAGRLSDLGESITGIRSTIEPTLYLWGICLTEDMCEPWHLLIEARKRFESDLPVERPLTEPDIALHLPGKYLILIEAKFTSKNTHYKSGPRANDSSLTKDELVAIYQDSNLNIVNVKAAEKAERVFYQLWRNTVFAEWMSQLDHPNTLAFHVNLVMEGQDEDSAFEFRRLVNEQYQGQFQRMTWEQIYRNIQDDYGMSRLRRYLETKTAGLKPAFLI